MIWAEGATIQARTISVDFGQSMSAESGATDLDRLMVNRFRLLWVRMLAAESGHSTSAEADAF